ncbi:MAG: glucosaminidase domain-containing protein [Chitinophagaceae bacterium]|nr:glucosaminidase domain-containing protein [Chitinophagaceae bacterium]
MQKLRTILFGFLFTPLLAASQQSEQVKSYINRYKDLAIEEMIRTGVPAAITLAQGIHESGAGNSDLAQRSNNHFGIKCKTSWTGEKVYHDDDARGECFRKYSAVIESYKDHSDFLKTGQRYAFLFELDPTDYAGWANGLKKAGYATNPRYPQVLIKLIEDYSLQEYTLIALGDNGEDDPLLTGQKETTKPAEETPQEVVTDVPVEEKTNAGKPSLKYPEGIFYVNDTKVIFAKKGTSYFAIASEYKIDLSKIFEFNEISQAEFALSDQLVYLQRKRKTGNEDYHIVLPGETLHDIAQQEAIRLESLQELNWLNPGDMPAVGVRLSLKKKATSTLKLALKNDHSLF